MNQLDRAVEATGWRREVVEHLYKACQEQTDLGFQDFIAAHVGQAAFFLAANQGMDLEGCLMAQEIGIELFSLDCSQTTPL